MDGKCIACNGEAHLGLCPSGITISKTTRQVFVALGRNHGIRVLNPDFTFSHAFGGKGSGQGAFNEPFDETLDSKGFVYVADHNNHHIQKFTPKGRFVDMFGTKGSNQVNSVIHQVLQSMIMIYCMLLRVVTIVFPFLRQVGSLFIVLERRVTRRDS